MTAAPRSGTRKMKSTPHARAGVRIKRLYDDPEPADGTRILIDRLWPRGVSKEKAGFHSWIKEAAPSNELRRWYGHDPERFAEFRRRYLAELKATPESLAALREAARGGTVTLLTATRELELSHAEVLRELLMKRD
jgi:uncharacterized protein YeaO (DUF488 family)